MNKKKFGIWGFGKVGKSVAQLLASEGHKVSVMTKNELSEDEIAWMHSHSIRAYTEDEKEVFFNNNVIIPSPGVDIRAYYQTHKDKWLAELDLFYSYFKKPIIAITGSVGKTTITSMLDHILKEYRLPICTGGNIGTPACDLIAQQDDVTYALLEVSSFQLEHCVTFTPSLAIWTNLAPNHLDRHTLDEYFAAKYKILAYQSSDQKALVPLSLAQKIKRKKTIQRKLHFFSSTAPTEKEQETLHHDDVLFFIDDNHVKKLTHKKTSSLIAVNVLPDITFIENWLIICSALDILGLDLQELPAHTNSLALPAHRMEKIITALRDIVFYNDSKSTTTTSTRAAIEKLRGKSIVLFVGGLSKGVDRTDFIKELKSRVKIIYCFGAESSALYALCVNYAIPAHAFSTLDQAFEVCTQNLVAHDHVLFSPAGSSFDLFKNYEERGDYFKQLVRDFITPHTTT